MRLIKMTDPFDFIRNLKNNADFLSVAFSYKNLLNGCHWGFDNHNDLIDCDVVYEDYLQEQKTNPIMRDQLNIYKLGKPGTYLIETANFSRPNTIMFHAFGQDYAKYNRDSIAKVYNDNQILDTVAFTKLLMGKYAGTLAIYGCSPVGEFLVNGKVYPSYKLRADFALQILAQAGYEVHTLNNTWVSPESFSSLEDFFLQHEKIPSGEGLMMHVRPKSA